MRAMSSIRTSSATAWRSPTFWYPAVARSPDLIVLMSPSYTVLWQADSEALWLGLFGGYGNGFAWEPLGHGTRN